MQAVELGILDAIQAWLGGGFLDAVMPAVSRICDHGEVWILLSAVLLAFRRTRRAGAAMACALVLDLVCCNLILKPLVGRVRPFAVSGAALLIPPPLDASFPSGHTASSFAAAWALWRAAGSWRAGLPAMALAAVIAFSRLYLYVHWPSDVLGGAALGLACGWAGERLAAALWDRWNARKEGTA